MKVYLVNTIDEWYNVTLIGFYNDLKVAEAEIKRDFAHVKDIEDLELKEYTSTFSRVFDVELYDDESGEFLRIFGYILDLDKVIDNLVELKK